MSFIQKFAPAAALTLAVALSATSATAEWRGWNFFDADYPTGVAMDAFTDKLAELSDGELTGKTFHNGVLGSGADAISQVRLGALEFSAISLGTLGATVDEANVASLPFIFKNVDHMHRVLDSEIGAQISDAMADQGFVPVSWYDSGARSFYNTERPITAPADLEGLKIRVMGNEIFVNMVNDMGGNGTPMAFGEVFQSLKTGVIDGAENNYPSYESTNHFEVAQFYSLTEHLIIPDCLCVSKVIWDGLSAEQQAMVTEAGQHSQAVQRAEWAARVEASKAAIIEAGVVINAIDDKTPFQDAMASVYDGFIAQYPDLEGLVNDIKNFD